MLTQTLLKELFYYDPLTGEFKRYIKKHLFIGDTIKSINTLSEPIGSNTNGYLEVCINYKRYLLHRLAWFYMYGIWAIEIDHIDTNKKNNSISNLRNITHAENLQNKRKCNKNNKSGYLGVSEHPSNNGTFLAFITFNRKSKNLGNFKTAEEAHLAYIDAKRKIHKFGTL